MAKTTAKIIGETIFPKISPNLAHTLFKGVSNLEFIMPRIKKIVEKNKNQKLIFSPFVSGHKASKSKTIKKTIPKLLFELILFIILRYIRLVHISNSCGKPQ